MHDDSKCLSDILIDSSGEVYGYFIGGFMGMYAAKVLMRYSIPSALFVSGCAIGGTVLGKKFNPINDTHKAVVRNASIGCFLLAGGILARNLYKQS